MSRHSAAPLSKLDRAAKAATAGGYTAYTHCVCGNTRLWEFDTDQMTGSSYARCRCCHRVHPFKGAWRDNSLGMNFGSWWSQQIADGFVVE